MANTYHAKMNAATETLEKARKFSEGIAEWIDAQRAAGRSELDIVKHLKAATDLAQYERKSPARALKG